MVTCRATGATKLVFCLQLSTATASSMLSRVLTSICSVLADPHWRRAMEYEALLSNIMWDFNHKFKADVVTDKWIFKHKIKADGSLDRYKARWVL
jgi:hypothetical protein